MSFVGILPLLLLLPVAAQDLNARLTRAQAISDVKRVVELLEATHPDPYINQGGKIEFKRAAQELVANIPAEGLTVRQLGDRLDPFLRRLRDGHTFLFYYTDKWRDPDSWLPVRFGLASDGLFLSAFDLKQLAGTQGWRVVGANGLTLDQITEMNARETGPENLYGALEKVANTLRSLKFMNNLLGGMNSQGSITYNLEAPDGRREDRTIPWSTRGAWDPDKALASTLHWTGLKPSAEMFNYQLFDDPPAAYLRIGTVMGREAYEMALRANPESGRSMLKDYYQQIKMPVPTDLNTAVAGVPSLYDTTAQLLKEMKRRSVNALVIDLRGNSGGWTDSAFPALQAIYGDAFFAQPLPGTWVHVESALYLEKNAETSASRLKRESGFELGRYVFERDDDRRPAEEQRAERVADYASSRQRTGERRPDRGSRERKREHRGRLQPCALCRMGR